MLKIVPQNKIDQFSLWYVGVNALKLTVFGVVSHSYFAVWVFKLYAHIDLPNSHARSGLLAYCCIFNIICLSCLFQAWLFFGLSGITFYSCFVTAAAAGKITVPISFLRGINWLRIHWTGFNIFYHGRCRFVCTTTCVLLCACVCVCALLHWSDCAGVQCESESSSYVYGKKLWPLQPQNRSGSRGKLLWLGCCQDLHLCSPDLWISHRGLLNVERLFGPEPTKRTSLPTAST